MLLRTKGSGHTRPLDIDLAVVCKAISEIKIDEALVRYARLGSHALEVLNHIPRQAHGD